MPTEGEYRTVIPIFLEKHNDHVLDHIDTYIEEAIKDTDDELLGGTIVAEFLGVSHYFDFMVMEEGEKRWTNMVTGTDTIH